MRELSRNTDTWSLHTYYHGHCLYTGMLVNTYKNTCIHAYKHTRQFQIEVRYLCGKPSIWALQNFTCTIEIKVFVGTKSILRNKIKIKRKIITERMIFVIFLTKKQLKKIATNQKKNQEISLLFPNTFDFWALQDFRPYAFWRKNQQLCFLFGYRSWKANRKKCL